MVEHGIHCIHSIIIATMTSLMSNKMSSGRHSAKGLSKKFDNSVVAIMVTDL